MEQRPKKLMEQVQDAIRLKHFGEGIDIFKRFIIVRSLQPSM